jgi:class 3 adenylate cyclase/tetratricopeptide (TPR) repeat protein
VKCVACGHENRDAAKFCEACAAALGRRCGNCGKELRVTATFCDECATPVAKPAANRSVDPRSYTPKHLAEKILTSRNAIEGERKQVTVLFADVKGSSELASERGPEEWHGIMEHFFRILTDGIHRFEGTVNQYTGDGIMALFGAPIAHEDHAQRACYAALHLRDQLRCYADELRIARGLNFSVRTGLNSGEVVVGKIGDDLRMDYTALGHTANLAARMEQIAEPGSIYLAEPTARLVEGFFQLRDLGRHEVKGIPRPVGVFELEAAGDALTRLQVAERRGFSRFVGREAETRALASTLGAALEGQGRVVGVVGEPGVGKSRLCREFVVQAVARGISVYEGHCLAHGKTIPYLPILELFRVFFGITVRDTAVEARRKIAGGLLLLDESFREVLPLVFEFLAVPDPKNAAPQMDPQAKQRQLYAFLRSLLRARSEAEPAVIFLDDLHWVDNASDTFLAEIVEAIEGTRTLCLLNFRPEYSAGWMRKSSYQQIALQPLGPREIEELVADLVGRDPSVAGLAERIRERTGGNPFFVEETVHELAETGKLDGRRGAYRLVASVTALDLPATVQSVLAARIDRLPEREKATLQAASVIGKNFPQRVLREVAGLVDSELVSSLSALRDRELVYEEKLFPEAEYAFKHPLTHEVAYQSQLATRRRAVHASVARAIEKLYPEKLDEWAALLAHHWEAAGNRLEAARWNRRAAEWSGANAPSEAVRCWKKVRELIAELPEDHETQALGISACQQILGFGFRVGMPEEEGERLFVEGCALAERAGDVRSLAAVHWSMSSLLAIAGNIRRAIDVGAEAVRIADTTDDTGIRLAVRCGLTWAYYNAGLLKDACELNDRMLVSPPEDPRVGADITGFAPYVFLSMMQGLHVGYLGDLARAERVLKHAFEMAGRHRGDVEILCWGRLFANAIAELAGDGEAAFAYVREGLEVAERMSAPFARAFARVALARAHLLRGSWTDGAGSAGEALAIAREHRTGLEFEALALASLAEAQLGAGDPALAQQTALEAIATAERRGTFLWEIFARLALAKALLAAGGAATADLIGSHLERAFVLVESSGAKALEPFVRIELAKLARLRGDKAAHEREMRAAHRLFLEIGAPIRAAAIAKEIGP